jgi:methyl halide transferase
MSHAAPPDIDWQQRYATNDTPWDTHLPSAELVAIIEQIGIAPSRVLEIGCGTGVNAVHLARQGFDVTAMDLSPLAIERAKHRAAEAGVRVNFFAGDAFNLPDLGQPFPFVFDRGVYHCLRQVNLPAFVATLRRVTAPGSLYLTLAGNANDAPREVGPPVVHAHEICRELSGPFDLIQLRECRFETSREGPAPLAWSALFRRRAADRAL